MKSALENSALFRDTPLYFPDPSDTSSYRPLTPGSRQIVIAEIRMNEKALSELYKAKSSAVAAYLKRPLMSPYGIKIDFIDDGRPVAQTSADAVTTITSQVTKSLLRGALVEAAMAPKSDPLDIPSASTDDTFIDLNPAEATSAEESGLQTLVTDMQAVHSTKAHGMLSDVAQGFSGDPRETSWSKLIDLNDKVNHQTFSYSGAMLFLLAHEQGHVVLGHAAQLANVSRASSSYCSIRRNQEQEADTYALLILSPYFFKVKTTPSLDFYHLADASTGYKGFFQYSYPLSGFLAGDSCGYPSNRERYDYLLSIDNSLKSSVESQFESDFAKAAAEAIKKQERH